MNLENMNMELVGYGTLLGRDLISHDYLTIGESYFINDAGKLFDSRGLEVHYSNFKWKTIGIDPDLLPEVEKLVAGANRFNSGKTQLSYMLDANIAMEGMCKVFEFGAIKYARGNWKKGLDVTECIDSLLRHLIAYHSGKVLDLNEHGEADASHSGLPHIDHIMCNAVFISTFGDRDGD